MAIKAVFGGAAINPNYGAFSTESGVEELLKVLKEEGVTTIDSARLYDGSEVSIGKAPGHEDFIIDTKIQGGFLPGTAAKDAIIRDVPDSLNKAQIKQFDILYLHSPDKDIPITETLEGVNDAYNKGSFKRFGLSNFSAEQVQEVYDISKSKGWVLPSVYQGSYAPIARKQETELFPTLRKLGFSFYAYSPLAGGFLTKTTQQLDEGAGRFNDQAIGGMYNSMYNNATFREVLGEWNDIAEKEGISKAELAYRWVAYNSALDEKLGDAVIFGASSLKQVSQTAQGLKKGPLSADAAKRIDAIWKKVEHQSVLDNFTWASSQKK